MRSALEATPEELAYKGQQGYTHVHADHNIETIARQLHERFSAIAGKGTAPAPQPAVAQLRRSA
jgi:hypothetical protein